MLASPHWFIFSSGEATTFRNFQTRTEERTSPSMAWKFAAPQGSNSLPQ
jgi:hypothetical protein